MIPETLGRYLYTLISSAVKITGTFDPEQTLPHMEEYLTQEEHLQVNMFLTWCHGNNVAFGSGNYEEVYAQFYKVELNKQAASDQYWETNTMGDA